jgi:prepilin-type N-terminal cleavage/methylation domain-containing protein
MKKQTGMTMVELVVAIAVTGIIIVFLSTAIYQIFTISEYGNDRLTALHELQNTAHWFNLDSQEARTATGGNQLVLTLADNSTISYSLVGTELRRASSGSQMTLARNITSASFAINNRTVTMYLNSSPVGRNNVSENGTYMVSLRPAEGG